MNPEEAEAVVRWVIQKDIGEKEAAMPLSSRLEEDLGFDDLDYVETVMLVEKRIASPEVGEHWQVVNIPDEMMAEWKTLQDIVDTILEVTTPGYGRLP